MTSKKTSRAVECSDYSNLHDYVSAVFQELDDQEVSLLLDDDDFAGDEIDPPLVEDLELMLMETLRNKKI